MRKLCFFGSMALAIFLGSTWAGTIDVWVGPTGSFADGTKWQNGGPSTWTSTSSSDELKITANGTVCTVSTAASNWPYKLSVASGPAGSTMEIAAGGSLGLGEVRIGSAGATSVGSIGYANQTGGTFSVKDLILGRYASGKPTAQGYYTISSGTLTYNSGATGRLYVGAGNNGGYTEGTFTIVGSTATILMDSLYVGSENGTNYGKGTLVYQVGAGGISPIVVSNAVYLDTAGTNSIANLIVSTSATSLPVSDILLVHVTSTTALTGTFDALNSGLAAEGTEITLAGNTYKLTYQYAAEAGANNDIALVYQGAVNSHATDPIPADGAQVDLSLAGLDWTNPAPGVAGNPVYCDVYLGTTQDRASMDKVTLGNDISQVDINTANFPTYGTLHKQTQYYWAVDVHDAGNVLTGLMWGFYVNANDAPVVNAGPDQVSWLGKSGIAVQESIALDGTTSDDGTYTVLWTQVSNGSPSVTISPNNVDDTSVTVTARGVYVFKLTANDGVLQAFDTVQITVGSTSCDASHLSTGAAYNTMDINHDCAVNLEDFAAVAAEWLICTDTLTNCGL